jgi:hypothetical protein
MADTTTRPKAKQTADQEFKALIACQKAFESVEDEARARILAYLNSRYGAKPKE